MKSQDENQEFSHLIDCDLDNHSQPLIRTLFCRIQTEIKSTNDLREKKKEQYKSNNNKKN